MRNILIALLAVVFVCSFASAQLSSSAASDIYEAEVIGNLALTVDGTGYIGVLSPGYTYTLNPDIAGSLAFPVTPVINGSETGTPMIFTLASDPGVSAEVTFQLPSVLIATGLAGGALYCSFGPQSLYITETGALLNPNVANILAGGVSGGTFTMNLGITVVVPPTAAADIYSGVVACTASLVGLY